MSAQHSTDVHISERPAAVSSASTSMVMERKPLVVDMLVAKYREEYNRTLVQRVTAEARLGQLRAMEEEVTQRAFGEYAGTTDCVAVQPVLRETDIEKLGSGL